MPLVRGPADPDAFRVTVHGARWYKDPLPADTKWPAQTEPVPAVTTIKKSWNKPFRKRTPTGLTVPLDAYRAAQYVADNLEQLSDMLPDQAFALVATAPERDLAAAAQRGTGVHSLIEGIADGQLVAPELLDDDVRPFLPACEKFVEEWRPSWLMTEFIVIERSLGFAGTADALVTFGNNARCTKCGNAMGVTLVDWKSRGGAHGAYPEEVCQLGGYSLGEYVVVSDDQGAPVRRPPPTVDHAAIVSLTADDGYRLYPVEIAEARRAFLGMFETWRLRRDGESTARRAVGNPASPPRRAGAPIGVDELPATTVGDDVQNGSGGQSDVRSESRHQEARHESESGGDGGPPSHPLGDPQLSGVVDDADLMERGVEGGRFFVVALGQWLRSRVVDIVGAGRPLPLPWPADVPTFKSGTELTPDHLEAIERWCDDTEMMLGLPFPTGRPAEPNDEPDESQLPTEVDHALPAVSDEALEWAEKGRALLSLLDDDLARACARVAQCDAKRMTRLDYLALAAVVTQVSDPAGLLYATYNAEGVTVVGHKNMEIVLLVQMPRDKGNITKTGDKPTKTDALRRGRRVAKRLGLKSPKNYEELCGNLLLAACVAAGHGVSE